MIRYNRYDRDIITSSQTGTSNILLARMTMQKAVNKKVKK
jgi:hypothetical protein